MRNLMKKDILEIFNNTYKVHSIVKEFIEKEDFKNVQLLLEDCRNTALQICTIIEDSEGEGFVTAGLIKDYCETINEILMNLSDEYNANNALKNLDKKLVKVKNSIRNDIKVKLEIVFCPYKASMWDSLESIWKAADKDPDCSVHVVPVPYYDKMSDGSLREKHYEGEEFPEYVPITHYEEYDFELNRPDIIYFHNPYDEINYVTTVDPKFYSCELKKYTSLLIYVPYFVLPGEFDEQFALQSGVVNADMVFVQNEHIRQGYINTLSVGFDKNILKEKIIAIGSPKTDKIINARISDYKIPESWKETAGERKVIFFNTNVSMLLTNPDHVLENLERIFSIVNSTKTFCLLWREHPLTEITLDSMLPGLRTEYHNLRNRFVEEKWGILDDLPDPYPAMLFSDCYYGAGGSLSAIYPVTGKPILITDYKYPERISPEPISLKAFKKSFTLRMLYSERNINSLSLFLENLSVFEAQKEERIKRQSTRMDNLDGSVGLKIHKKVKHKLL